MVCLPSAAHRVEGEGSEEHFIARPHIPKFSWRVRCVELDEGGEVVIKNDVWIFLSRSGGTALFQIRLPQSALRYRVVDAQSFSNS